MMSLISYSYVQHTTKFNPNVVVIKHIISTDCVLFNFRDHNWMGSFAFLVSYNAFHTFWTSSFLVRALASFRSKARISELCVSSLRRWKSNSCGRRDDTI